jgi:hypothetical protein
MLSSVVDSADDMSWCPTANCGYAFVKVGPEHYCPLCGNSYCLDCRVEMHLGMTCIEYKADKVNKEDDSEIINILANVIKAKQCP